MLAILTVILHDRGKCSSTLPIALAIDMVSSFGINAVNQMVAHITSGLPDHINKAIPNTQFKKIIRMCVESEFDIPYKVSAHDRYDIRYSLIYVR